MAAIPLDYLNALVSISYRWTDGSTWRSQATGFLYGRLCHEGSIDYYDVYLISSEHCFRLEDGSAYESVLVSFNPRDQSQPAIIAELPLCHGESLLWTSIPGTDVAVIRMGLWELHNHDIDYVFFRSDVHSTNVRQLRAYGCAEGEPIFILGFEAGLPEIRRNHPIVRSGAIARIQDVYEGDSSIFIVEATVFHGTSGGPVFLNPTGDVIRNNGLQQPPLIGLVSA